MRAGLANDLEAGALTTAHAREF